MRPSNNLENKSLSDTYGRVQLVRMKVQAQFFRTTTGIQSGPDAFDESRFVMTFLTILGGREILCSLRLVLEGKTGKKIPESSRLEFLEKFLANNFALSYVKDNTFGPFNRRGIAVLSLFRTLLAIRQKSREPSFWERMDYLVLVAYASLAEPNLNPLKKFTSSNRSTEFKDISPWNISQMMTKTIPISTRIVISYTMKRDIPL